MFSATNISLPNDEAESKVLGKLTIARALAIPPSADQETGLQGTPGKGERTFFRYS